MYDAFSEGRRLRTVSLRAADTRTGDDSIYRADNRGRRRVDLDRLGRQLKARAPVIKADLKDIPGMAPVLETLNQNGDLADIFGETLFGWAKSWNESLVHHKEHDNDIDTSAAAQFMRYASNVGASAEYDPGKGNVALKAEAAASLVVASGHASVTRYLPNRLGAHVAFKLADGIVDLGLLRIVLECQASGFVGASLQLEAQLQVITTPNRDGQAITGQPGGRLPRFREQRSTGRAFHQQMNDEDEGLSVSAEVFAGVRAQLGIKGSVQWLKPIGPHDRRPAQDLATDKAAEYVDFCSISQQISGLLGKGAGAKFFCKFVNGKFCFHVSASVCGGVGAKGAFEAEVSAKNMGEFAVWLVYQLYLVNYRRLSFLDDGTFDFFTKYSLLHILIGPEPALNVFSLEAGNKGAVSEFFSQKITQLVDTVKGNVQSVRERNELAANTISRSEQLLCMTPEAKSILLYLLTRNTAWDRFGHAMDVVKGKVFDKYAIRKKAVLEVLRSVQTLAEWKCILYRFGPSGAAPAAVRESVVQENRGTLVAFLKIGLDQHQHIHELESELVSKHGEEVVERAKQKANEEMMAFESRLKKRESPGFAICFNDTYYYKICQGVNSAYPAISTFEEFDGGE
ncbi:hypothetical protein [Pseudomonas sp. KNUC1026]|uniref:hypothetical protein n=1 Tax=Pseudomonas sp. KNUC1026 TaxID=2893890 RepID=UPI001F203832|nr:hypothetical protein [Pseudomonas sp. KNUC1026]UFH51523.1 hypothetical protein LN139_11435 [Pseudomonas sp. KNUC1026]